MKILNRPMFRMGGPIKEGIMDGIQEPRRIGYAVKGTVSASDQAKAFENIFAANNNNMRPVNTLNFEVPNNSILNNNKMTDKNNDGIINQSDYYYDEGQRRKEKGEMFEKFIAPNTTDEFLNNRGYEYKNPNYKKPLDAVSDINIEKARIGMPENISKDMGSKNLPNVKDIIEKKGMTDDTPLTKKERTNNILEMLGYDKAKKNALYDAMIKAGQRVSRTGLGADNLVSDVIQDTSTSYDKPEKLREAANLMDVQQQLKLDQIDASKDTRSPIQKNAEYFLKEGIVDNKKDAILMAQGKATDAAGIFFEASQKMNASQALNQTALILGQKGDFGKGVEFKNKIKKEYRGKPLSDFIKSDDFRGDGIYTADGKIIVIQDGEIKNELIIRGSTEDKLFSFGGED